MRGVRRLMSCTAWSVFSLAALVCALALFLAYLLAQRLSLRKTGFYGTLVAVAVFMLTSWFAMGERREMLDDTQAVVMSLSTAVKSSPDKSATDLFVLHEGTLVEITDRLDNWCEITIADGKKGVARMQNHRNDLNVETFTGRRRRAFETPGRGTPHGVAPGHPHPAHGAGFGGRMTESIDRFRNEIRYCSQCNNLSDEEVCPICADRERDHATICVVEQVADVLSVENTRQYRGMYHVLGGVISPMQGISPSDLKIDLLCERIARGGVKEVILAISTSVEGGDDAFLPDEPPAAVPGAESYVDRARHRFRRRTGICRRTDDHPRADEPPGDRVARPA